MGRLCVQWRFTVAFLTALVALGLGSALTVPALRTLLADDATLLELLVSSGLQAWVVRVCWLAVTLAVAQAVAIFAVWARRGWSLRVLKVASAAFAAFWLYLPAVIIGVPRSLHAANPDLLVAAQRDSLYVLGMLLWAPGVVLACAMLLGAWCRSTRSFFLPESPAQTEPLADRILQDLKTHGQDPGFRTSTYWSAFLHAALLVLPFLLAFEGCFSDAYEMPFGSGEVVVQVVRMKKPKKKKLEQMVLNLDSPFLHWRPEDTEMDKILYDETEARYEANKNQKTKTGVQKGSGGWPSGTRDGVIRFIRLKYTGGDWDQDMGFGADYNILLKLHEMTGFRIAKNTEAIAIGKLSKFKKGRKPPFVFLTGRGGIGVSTSEVRVLRNYCLKDGGMIFADNGGGHFDRHFRNLMRRVFPDLYWVDIPNDDIIYRQPFLFPYGAPKMWHHSGTRALGLRHNGRWVVFYHPGDLNDGWKTGHSGASAYLSALAYKMGINVINYAFNQYHRLNYASKQK